MVYPLLRGSITPSLGSAWEGVILKVKVEGGAMEFRKGQYVRIHPATDLFMKGVAYATIVKIGRKWVTLYHDLSGTTHRVSHKFAQANLEPVTDYP